MSDWPPNMRLRPLQHPPAPNARRTRSGFSAPWSATLTLLTRELQKLGARDKVLEIDLGEQDFRLDGLPRANARQNTPAVALSFQSKHGPLRYACDRYATWQDNVRAIALSLESLRAVDRHEVLKSGEQYRGNIAIEAGTAEPPRAVLLRHSGLVAGPSVTDRQLYAAAIRRVHPDIPVTGNPDAFAEVQAARAALVQAGQW